MKVRSITGCIFLTTLTFGKEYKLGITLGYRMEEALPISNGRIGAMVYGNPLQEVYQLNRRIDLVVYPQDWNNPKAANALPQVREAVDGDAPRQRTLESQCTRSVYSPLPAYGKPDARPTDAGKRSVS